MSSDPNCADCDGTGIFYFDAHCSGGCCDVPGMHEPACGVEPCHCWEPDPPSTRLQMALECDLPASVAFLLFGVTLEELAASPPSGAFVFTEDEP